MLWIGGQISSMTIIGKLLLPSMISLLVPLMIASFMIKGEFPKSTIESESVEKAYPGEQRLIFFSGVGVLLAVPIFKTITHLPPFMGMLLGLGFLWILTQLVHRRKNEEERHKLSVNRALQRMDVPSVLFFMGILLAVGVLQATGLLSELSAMLMSSIENENIIVACIGLLSAVVDNVPIVAATIGMYSLDAYPVDHSLWLLLAFCAGTGGSLLIIGSAAGVAAMGIEQISFGWYLKNISWLAAAGYLAGVLAFILQGN